MVAVVSTFKTHQPCVILCMDLGTPLWGVHLCLEDTTARTQEVERLRRQSRGVERGHFAKAFAPALAPCLRPVANSRNMRAKGVK